ncbi:UNVERIFIED_CONTAM: hypothetical protein HDU68_007665 [Siphonaria sp. JEL0065]|nr:hypothetical protein HDU68_007665 [Siphonaria sp. JEL0065]
MDKRKKEKKDKKDKKSKHKKEKKEKKEKKGKHHESDSSSSEDVWQEAPATSVSATTAPPPPLIPEQPPVPTQVRSSWMTDAAPATSEDPLAMFGLRASDRKAQMETKVTAADEERIRKEAIRKDREINKDFFVPDFGVAKPGEPVRLPPQKKEAAAVVFGDSKSNWRMMRLKRLLEAAEEEGRDVKDLALERWGSLDELNTLQEERDFLDKKSGKKPASAKQADSHQQRTTEKYKSSSDFKRPRLSDEKKSGVDEFGRDSRATSVSTQKNASASRIIPSAATGGIIGSSSSALDLSEGPILSMDELNKMNARILRNSMMGMDDKELISKYNREKERHEQAVASGAISSDQDATIVVPTIDSRGRLQDIGSGVDAARLPPGNTKRKREDLKATHDESGQRINYPGESEAGSTINDLLLQEKMATAGSYDQEIANRITRDVTYREDLDYMDDKADDLAKKTQVSDYAKRQNAISDFKKANSALEKCLHCFQEATGAPKSTVLATGTRVYLSLPNTIDIVPYHCQIVPIAHTLTSLELDDDDWTEIRNFMKCLIQMNWERGQGCIFMEQVVNFKWHKHTVIDCVPVPLGKFEDAPAYFREAIEASEEEWSQHKKVIDTAKNGFRRSMVKNLPYFHVWFEPNKGYGHVIEDSQEWPDWFGREVLGSMMELSPDKWRRPKRASYEESDRRRAVFKAAFDKFDWTKALG